MGAEVDGQIDLCFDVEIDRNAPGEDVFGIAAGHGDAVETAGAQVEGKVADIRFAVFVGHGFFDEAPVAVEAHIDGEVDVFAAQLALDEGISAFEVASVIDQVPAGLVDAADAAGEGRSDLSRLVGVRPVGIDGVAEGHGHGEHGADAAVGEVLEDRRAADTRLAGENTGHELRVFVLHEFQVVQDHLGGVVEAGADKIGEGGDDGGDVPQPGELTEAVAGIALVLGEGRAQHGGDVQVLLIGIRHVVLVGDDGIAGGHGLVDHGGVIAGGGLLIRGELEHHHVAVGILFRCVRREFPDDQGSGVRHLVPGEARARLTVLQGCGVDTMDLPGELTLEPEGHLGDVLPVFLPFPDVRLPRIHRDLHGEGLSVHLHGRDGLGVEVGQGHGDLGEMRAGAGPALHLHVPQVHGDGLELGVAAGEIQVIHRYGGSVRRGDFDLFDQRGTVVVHGVAHVAAPHQIHGLQGEISILIRLRAGHGRGDPGIGRGIEIVRLVPAFQIQGGVAGGAPEGVPGVVGSRPVHPEGDQVVRGLHPGEEAEPAAGISIAVSGEVPDRHMALVLRQGDQVHQLVGQDAGPHLVDMVASADRGGKSGKQALFGIEIRCVVHGDPDLYHIVDVRIELPELIVVLIQGNAPVVVAILADIIVIAFSGENAGGAAPAALVGNTQGPHLPCPGEIQIGDKDQLVPVMEGMPAGGEGSARGGAVMIGFRLLLVGEESHVVDLDLIAGAR